MKLYSWQKKQGLSHAEMAKVCKVHLSTVYGWYQGTRFPSRKKAMFIHQKVTGGAVSFLEAIYPTAS
jgi:transposase